MLKYLGMFLELVNEVVTFIHKVIGLSFFIYEYSPHKQFAWNELPS
jgi:hypothetical protein